MQCNDLSSDMYIGAHISGNQSCIGGYDVMYYQCVNGNTLCFNHADLIFMAERTLN